jgi:hypothetical protein
MNLKNASMFTLLALGAGLFPAAAAGADTLTWVSGKHPASGTSTVIVTALAKSAQDLPADDAQEGVPVTAPTPVTQRAELPAPELAPAPEPEAEGPEVTDIYAPDPNRKGTKFHLGRSAGDTDVLLLPSARPLDEGQVHVALDELLLWRGEMGVSDEFSLGVDSAWGLTLDVNGKYAFVRRNNTAVALRLGVGAATVEKKLNWSYAELLYSKDMRRGAVHLGAHLVFAHTPDGDSYLVPQATVGGEVKLIKHVSAMVEGGFGNDVLAAAGLGNNTGFANLGVRLYVQGAYVTGALVIPTNEHFMNSAALGIPFIRFGYVF